MTNLPISVNVPQPNANAANLAATGPGAEDNGGELFAALLARQFGELASGMPPGLSVAVDATEAAETLADDAALAGAIIPEVALDAEALSAQSPAADASAAVAGILAQISQLPRGKAVAEGAGIASGSAADKSALARGVMAQGAPSMSAVALQTAPGKGEGTQVKPDAAPGSTISAVATARQPADGKAQADVFAAAMKGAEAAAQASAGNASLSAPAGVTQQAAIQAAQAAALSAQTLPSAQAGVTAVMQQTISTPVGDEGWAGDFSQKIVWMGNQQNQVAELHLNPPDLGPLDVVLKVSDNQATALFTSPHAAVREAVEQALPRLRETLADNGITLGNATVSDQPPRERDMSGFAGRQGGGARTDETAAASGAEHVETASASAGTMRRHDGMIDTFV